MKSQAIVELGQPLQEVDKNTPEPSGKEVLIQISTCGVCHTDLHLHAGHFDLGNDKKLPVKSDADLPFVLGHEIAGTVVAKGPDASDVTIGKSYSVYPWIGCGTCDICESGREHLCVNNRGIGSRVDGGFADHVLVPEKKYLVDIGDLDPALAGCYMCSGITAYSALKKISDVLDPGPYLLLGLGGVGMMALQMALALHDTLPAVADIDEAKLEHARSLGIKQVYNLNEPDIYKRINKETRGGFSGIIDFVGSEKTVNPAAGVVRKGGKLVVVGLAGGSLNFPLPLLAMKAISIQGTYVGSLQDAKEVIALAQSGKLGAIKITKRPMDEANEVLDSMRRGEILGRVVLTPTAV
jgi:D-arabinose 1-dehydrogenase-like Zn-dependent alcohol dehydrogenase